MMFTHFGLIFFAKPLDKVTVFTVFSLLIESNDDNINKMDSVVEALRRRRSEE